MTETKSVADTAGMPSVTEMTHYYYDERGNMTSKYTDDYGRIIGGVTNDVSVLKNNSNSSVELYEYDGFNRMTGVHKGGTIASYTYNAEGLRTDKTVNGDTTKFYLDGMNVVAEVNPQGQTTNYIRGAAGIVMSVGPGGTQYYNTNGHGDVVKLTNLDRSTAYKTYNYDAFGVQTNLEANGNDSNPFRYCSEYFDKETGDIYLRARYYSASIGRYNSQDPIMDGRNWYIYCANNPITWVDPSGLRIIIKGSGNYVSKVWGCIKDMSADDLELVQQKDADGNLIDSYEVFVRGEVNGICQNGTDLVRRLAENEDHIVTIRLDLTGNTHRKLDNGDSEVVFQPDYDPHSKTVDKDTGVVSRKAGRPAYIGLAHELIHADRNFRNTRIETDVGNTAEYTYRVRPSIYNDRFPQSQVSEFETETAEQEELATVGLAYVSAGDITENMIRAEHGEDMRGAY